MAVRGTSNVVVFVVVVAVLYLAASPQLYRMV